MSDFPNTAGLRSLLPSQPGPWLWSRMKVYLAVLAACVAGFFFFASWYAAPPTNSAFSFFQTTWSLLAAVIAVFGIRAIHRELDKQRHNSE